MIRHLFALFTVCLATWTPMSAAAATKPLPIAVAPGTIAAALAAAKPGDTLKLDGDFPAIAIRARSFVPPLVIDATGATVHGVALTGVDGVTWTGGIVLGNGTTDFTSPTGYGVLVRGSRHVSIARAKVTGWGRGIVVDTSTDIVVDRNWLTGLRTDGVDVALAQRVRLTSNVFNDFQPNPAYTDAAGVWHDGDHPDAIQSWSRPVPGGIVSDLTITGNVIVGDMQCISGFNHVRNGVDDGGFDRIVGRDNDCSTTSSTGITWNDCRGCTWTGNRVRSLPGARYKAQFNVEMLGGIACGNVAVDVPKALGTAACPIITVPIPTKP